MALVVGDHDKCWYMFGAQHGNHACSAEVVSVCTVHLGYDMTCLLADVYAMLNHSESRWGYVHRDPRAEIVAVGSSMVLT